MRRRGPNVRVLSDSDRAIWAGYAQGVVPRPGVAVPVVPELVREPVAVRLEVATATAMANPVAALRRAMPVSPGGLVVGVSPGGVDGSTWSRFRSGKLPVARTLDLHGRTAQLAHAALNHFLSMAASEGLRCVEVITGRGKGEGGVIRREFPHWLNQPQLRTLILGAAHPHALNTGSVRLLLRRRR